MADAPGKQLRDITPKGEQWSVWGPLAEHAFVEKGMRISSVLKHLTAVHNEKPRDIPPPKRGQLYRWRDMRDWLGRRTDFNRTSLPIQGRLTKQLGSLAAQLEKKDDDDAYKASLTIRNVMATLKDLGTNDQVEPLLRMFLKDQVDYIVTNAPELAQLFEPHLERIYQHILAKRMLSARGERA